MRSVVALPGLEGHEPLGFLSALGTLRALSTVRPSWGPRLFWRTEGSWRARLETIAPVGIETLIDAVQEFLQGHRAEKALALGDDLLVSPEAFREIAEDDFESAGCFNRQVLDFLSAFVSDAVPTEGQFLQDTAFRTMRGAGHQHFLLFMREIVRQTKREHIERALVQTWDYADPLRNLSLRWDPSEDRRYALQWADPSSDPSRAKTGSMLGANRLAIEALPFFPTAAVGHTIETTGFQGHRASDTFWSWPLWDEPLELDVVRSLVALDEIQKEVPDRSALLKQGVVEVYRSQRFSRGKYRNFSPGRSVGR